MHIVLVQFVPFVSQVAYNSLLAAAGTQPLGLFPRTPVEGCKCERL